MPDPARGDVWLADFGVGRGHEQAGLRPALVVSVDAFNFGPTGLTVALPLTTKPKGPAYQVRLDPPEGGVRSTSFVKCDDIRSMSRGRLLGRWGAVEPATLAAVEMRLRVLLNL